MNKFLVVANQSPSAESCTNFFKGKMMIASAALTSETIANLGIISSADVHSAIFADKLGIDLSGPEHDDVDPSDFVEVADHD